MEVPLELSFRNVERKPELVALIEEKVAKLEQVCGHLTSCRVAVEKPQAHQATGSPYRVRLDIQVPPGHEIVVSREAGQGELHEPVEVVVRRAFDAARRRLTDTIERQRGEVKSHPKQEPEAFITKLFRDEGYGFIRTSAGREIYFHRNSLPQDEFEKLTVGTPVAYAEGEADEGPQATTLRVIR